MFGFFKKKPDKAEVFRTTVSGLLQTQLLLGLHEESPKKVINDKFALGYIFGFEDAVLQTLDVSQINGLAWLAPVNGTLFDDIDFGIEMSTRCLQLQGDEEFSRGQLLGGNELLDFLQEKKPTMGLAQHMLETKA